MSFVEKLNFKKSPVVFEDGRKMLIARLPGNFKRENLINGINDLAKEFNDKDVQMGISCHYKNINKWGPALMSRTNQRISVWNHLDSPETVEAYRNDTIDHIYVTVIENKNFIDKHKYLRGNHK
jgi:hypothetical protein